MKTPSAEKKVSGLNRLVNSVEQVGNKLPHPFWLFVSLSIFVMLLSFVISQAGVEVTYLKASKIATHAPTEITVAVNNLLSKENIQRLFTDMTGIYSGFAPLGLVMIMMLSIGMLEQTGMLSALIRKTILGTPESLLILMITIVGVNANLASDAGVIVVPAIAGAVFKSLGINPWIGVISGYVAANGGFSASVFIAGTDVLLAGITESVTKGAGIDAPVHPMMNYYFMVASCLVIVGATILVTKFVIAKKLGGVKIKLDDSELEAHKVSEEEKKGLKYAGVAALLFIGGILALTLPEHALFRNAAGGLLPKSPLLSSVVSILFFFFFFLAIAYGKGSGSITKMDDVPKYMEQGISGALGFIVIALPASIFISLFNASKITTILGVWGGDILKSIHITGFPLLLSFLLIVTLMNLFITSGSSKWLIISPIFVPMLSRLGFSPALTQATYRIADTCTNIISPVDYYVPVIMGLLAIYNTDSERKVGIGTVISLCLPYSIAYAFGLIILLFVFYSFGLDLGPGVPMFMN